MAMLGVDIENHYRSEGFVAFVAMKLLIMFVVVYHVTMEICLRATNVSALVTA